MSSEELAKHRTGPKVYVAVKNLVYDVSKSESYREGGGYHAFAGRDASVALARMNFLEENFAAHWSQPGLLDDKQMTILNDWVAFFDQRYEVVGRLASPAEANYTKHKDD
jgi:membrane-associated progesterone receptor component